jgi:hypothetical protein
VIIFLNEVLIEFLSCGIISSLHIAGKLLIAKGDEFIRLATMSGLIVGNANQAASNRAQGLIGFGKSFSLITLAVWARTLSVGCAIRQ